MSLSRILNDDPIPVHNPRPAYSALSDRSPAERLCDDDHKLPHLDFDSVHPSRQLPPARYHPGASHSPNFLHQPGQFSSSNRDWEGFSGEWPRGQPPARHGSPPLSDLQRSRYMSPDPPHSTSVAPDPAPETLSRKRRKNGNDDSTYSAAAPRRVSIFIFL
jgi:hypothetical protein